MSFCISCCHEILEFLNIVFCGENIQGTGIFDWWPNLKIKNLYCPWHGYTLTRVLRDRTWCSLTWTADLIHLLRVPESNQVTIGRVPSLYNFTCMKTTFKWAFLCHFNILRISWAIIEVNWIKQWDLTMILSAVTSDALRMQSESIFNK